MLTRQTVSHRDRQRLSVQTLGYDQRGPRQEDTRKNESQTWTAMTQQSMSSCFVTVSPNSSPFLTRRRESGRVDGGGQQEVSDISLRGGMSVTQPSFLADAQASTHVSLKTITRGDASIHWWHNHSYTSNSAVLVSLFHMFKTLSCTNLHSFFLQHFFLTCPLAAKVSRGQIKNIKLVSLGSILIKNWEAAFVLHYNHLMENLKPGSSDKKH